MKYTIGTIIIVAIILQIVFIHITDEEVVPFKNELPKVDTKSMIGEASYYDYKIGDWSSVGHYVCATRDFIRYSQVKVINTANNKSVICVVTDYGPDESVFPERIIDLSSTAFSDIADKKLGVVEVIVEQLEI